jgi:hypothetical protein
LKRELPKPLIIRFGQWLTCNTPNNSISRPGLALACTQLTLGFDRPASWGIGELAGQLEISTCVPEAVSLGDEAASFYRGEAVPFDKEEFFKKQIEECRELESQAVSAEDRSFWRQAAGRWEQQLRQAQAQPRKRPQQCVQPLNQDRAKA